MAITRKSPMIIDTVESSLKSWWMLVAALSVATAVFITVGKRFPTFYEATAIVRVSQTAGGTHGLYVAAAAAGMHITETGRPGIFEVGVRDPSADRAARLVNALVLDYIDSRQKPSVEDSGTIEQLEAEALELQRQSDSADQELQRFRSKHPLETEEHRQRTLDRLAVRRGELETTRGQLVALRRRLAEAELAPAQAAEPLQTCGDPQVERLAAAKNDPDRLEKLLAGYVPTLEELRRHAECEAHAPTVEQADVPKPVDLEPLHREIASLTAEESGIRSEIEESEGLLAASPQREQELAQLSARYQDRKALQEARSSELSAARARMTSLAASRPELVARASAEGSRATDRSTIPIVAAVIAGLLLLGPVVVRELLWPSILSEAGLQAVSPVPVLVSIPQPFPLAVVEAGRRRMLMNIGLAIGSVAASFALVLS